MIDTSEPVHFGQSFSAVHWMFKLASLHQSEAEDDVMMIPDRAFLEELVRNPDSRASEFHMFRLVHTWCRGTSFAWSWSPTFPRMFSRCVSPAWTN